MRFDNINLDNSNLAKRLNSYQFKLSQDIFGKRINLNLDRDEAAKLTGLSVDEYTKIEQGIDLESNETEYQRVLDKLSSFAKTDHFDFELKDIDKKTIQHKGYEEVVEIKKKNKCIRLNTISVYQIKSKKTRHSLQIPKRKVLDGGYSNVNTAQIQWIHN